MDYNYVLNLHNLIVPKLEHAALTGGWATIHDSKTYLTKINNCRYLLKRTGKNKYLNDWKFWLDEAEKWLVNIAKG